MFFTIVKWYFYEIHLWGRTLIWSTCFDWILLFIAFWGTRLRTNQTSSDTLDGQTTIFVFLSFCLSVFLSFCHSVFLSFCLFLSFCFSVCPPLCLSVSNGLLSNCSPKITSNSLQTVLELAVAVVGLKNLPHTLVTVLRVSVGANERALVAVTGEVIPPGI